MGDPETETLVIGHYLCLCVCTEHYFDVSYGYEGTCALQEPRDKYGMPSITALSMLSKRNKGNPHAPKGHSLSLQESGQWIFIVPIT